MALFRNNELFLVIAGLETLKLQSKLGGKTEEMKGRSRDSSRVEATILLLTIS